MEKTVRVLGTAARTATVKGRETKQVNPTTTPFFLEAHSGPAHREGSQAQHSSIVNRGDRAESGKAEQLEFARADH